MAKLGPTVRRTIAYDIGANRFGQNVTLTCDPDGRWLIRKAAANQRDDTQAFEINLEQMRLIGLIAEANGGQG